MPVETLRILETDHLNVQLLKNELDKQAQLLIPPTPSHSMEVVVGIMGLIIGYLVGASIK